jgi:hypothetical protein
VLRHAVGNTLRQLDNHRQHLRTHAATHAATTKGF